MSNVHWFVAEKDPKNAGYRVRTVPLVAEWRAQGETVEVHALDTLPAKLEELGATARAVVVSKPADSLTALCLERLRALGVPVIIDLFDNYFSWSAAAAQRQLHWQWLRTLGNADLVVSSSDFLCHVIESLTDKPVLQLSDQVPAPPPHCLAPQWLAAKWAEPERIELLWFGIAGNPYYLAGLEDLLRWAGVLHSLALALADHAPLRLTLCTNRVPAVDVALQAMRAQQIDARYVEWSAPACDELLEQSHVVLLPTNLSGFSLSKTHNRCSDALARGCLVLSSPQGPYHGLGGAVFEDPQALAQVLHDVRPEQVRALVLASDAALRSRHDPVAEVARLRAAVQTLSTRPRLTRSVEESRLLIVASPMPALMAHARAAGLLVAACFEGPGQDDCDFRLETSDDDEAQLIVALSERAAAAAMRQLAREVDVDAEGYDDVIEYRVGDWRLVLERTALRLIVRQGLPAASLQRWTHAWREGANRDTALEARVEVMAQLLLRLGSRAISFAGDERRGWQAFADHADPALAQRAQQLQQLWIRFEGRELEWGRPVEIAPC